MRQRQPPHVHAQKREKTHFSLRRPPSTSSSTALNGLPPPHHRPCTALLPSSANTAQSPAGTRNVQHPPNQHHPPRFTGLPDAVLPPHRPRRSCGRRLALGRVSCRIPSRPPTALHRILLRTASTPPGTSPTLVLPRSTPVLHIPCSRRTPTTDGSARLQRHKTGPCPRGMTVLTY